MNLHPWASAPEGSPEDGTEEVVSTLESVIRRDPNHLGAIHYYIHALRRRVLPNARWPEPTALRQWPRRRTYRPYARPHYIRTGDYESAVRTNEKAALADQVYLKSSGTQGIYSMMYYSHNLHFIAMCAAMNGNYAEAKKGATMLAAKSPRT